MGGVIERTVLSKREAGPDFWLFYWQLDFILKTWYCEQQITQPVTLGKGVAKEEPTSERSPTSRISSPGSPLALTQARLLVDRALVYL